MSIEEAGRRIKKNENAKVVASLWWEEIIQLLAALAILPRAILKKRINYPFLSNHPVAIHPIIQNRPSAKQLAQQVIEYILPPKQKRRPLPSVFILLLCSYCLGKPSPSPNPHALPAHTAAQLQHSKL